MEYITHAILGAVAGLALLAFFGWISDTTVHAAPAESSGIAFVVRFDCDGQCAEPFFTPAFRFKVLEGTWPDKGRVIKHCHAAGTELRCADGLRLEVAGVIFR